MVTYWLCYEANEQFCYDGDSREADSSTSLVKKVVVSVRPRTLTLSLSHSARDIRTFFVIIHHGHPVLSGMM